ncbi:uncharacterized protein TrAtP1_002012 [Trichoderma atroviride]|uniref:uncharacterized protein n=1 Tax=Hypocrea atroviridis TaxID=63577 RepID=UPI00332AB1B6|nr:hypothetical protein TrAtP1_002012 [Trichoderma atroviride]
MLLSTEKAKGRSSALCEPRTDARFSSKGGLGKYKADRDEIQCRRLARAGSSRWGQRGSQSVGYYYTSRYLWLERRHGIGRHRPRKTVGVDDALSQGRECLPDSKAFPVFSLLSRRLHLPGKLNPGHNTFIPRALGSAQIIPATLCSMCEKQRQLPIYLVVEHCSQSPACLWAPKGNSRFILLRTKLLLSAHPTELSIPMSALQKGKFKLVLLCLRHTRYLVGYQSMRCTDEEYLAREPCSANDRLGYKRCTVLLLLLYSTIPGTVGTMCYNLLHWHVPMHGRIAVIQGE